MPEKFASIDAYLQTLPKNTQAILQKIRKTIQHVAPKATEVISYQIPAFKLNRRILIYFAGWKEHVSIYPIPHGDASFDAKLSEYQAGKGTLRFKLDRPIPYDLIKEIVRLRKAENEGSK